MSLSSSSGGASAVAPTASPGAGAAAVAGTFPAGSSSAGAAPSVEGDPLVVSGAEGGCGTWIVAGLSEASSAGEGISEPAGPLSAWSPSPSAPR